MERGTVTDKNREFLLSEYVDNIVMNLPRGVLEELAAHYIHDNRKDLSNELLQAEINHNYPHILDESLPCPYARK
jgi:hypothetical protein